MKKHLIGFVVVLAIFCSSCSSDSSSTPDDTPTHDYFKMTVDGTEINFNTTPNINDYNTVAYSHEGDKITAIINSGFFAGSTYWNRYDLTFDKLGNFLSFKRNTNGYSNYIYYPAHYFTFNVISRDEVNKRIKISFSGRIYVDKTNLNSESNEISGEFETSYGTDFTGDFNLGSSVPQYCNAKFNGTPWYAKFEGYYSIFTAEDAYKIVTHFDINAAPGSYNVTPGSTTNYIRFLKFNTTTLTYDNYDVTGVLAHSYREFHGANQYSYIGTFSFTAVNPNNPSDVIQVTDGTFRSYQQF